MGEGGRQDFISLSESKETSFSEPGGQNGAPKLLPGWKITFSDVHIHGSPSVLSSRAEPIIWISHLPLPGASVAGRTHARLHSDDNDQSAASEADS